VSSAITFLLRETEEGDREAVEEAGLVEVSGQAFGIPEKGPRPAAASSTTFGGPPPPQTEEE
jgi:hypothetical protein